MSKCTFCVILSALGRCLRLLWGRLRHSADTYTCKCRCVFIVPSPTLHVQCDGLSQMPSICWELLVAKALSLSPNLSLVCEYFIFFNLCHTQRLNAKPAFRKLCAPQVCLNSPSTPCNKDPDGGLHFANEKSEKNKFDSPLIHMSQ